MEKTVTRTGRSPTIRVQPLDRKLVEAAAHMSGCYLTEFARNTLIRT